jgi:hypothetical protein
MNEKTRKELAEDALNVALKFIQDQMGISEGDIAGVYFCGELSDQVQKIFADYINYEQMIRSKS